MLEFIYDEINNSKSVLAVFFDLKKAFDTIDYTILLAKLYGAGLRGVCLKLISNYLSNRQQKVKLMGCYPINLTSHVGYLRVQL